MLILSPQWKYNYNMAELYLAERINLKYQSQIMKYSTQIYTVIIKTPSYLITIL